MNGIKFSRILWVALLGPISAPAQQTTNFTFDFVVNNAPNLPYITEDPIFWVLTGSTGSLGSATLSLHSVAPMGSNGASTPIQFTGALSFNAIDSISLSFTANDPNFWNTLPYPQLTGGTITGGTGAYAGATGSLDALNFQPSPNPYMQGSGSVRVGGKTIPLNLTNFNGGGCGGGFCESWFTTGTVSGSSSLGSVSGSLKVDNTFHLQNSAIVPSGPMTLAFNGTDSVTVLMNFNDAPVVFPIVGGTGAYAGATGSLSVSKIHSGYSGYEYTGTGTVTTAAPGAPIITQVKMAYGSSTIAHNGWFEIHGTNLVPSDTPSTGVDWSNAPEFENGMMPTSLGAIDSVTFLGPNGGTAKAYIFFYCSAATDPKCTAGDQINVLAPLNVAQNVLRLTVTRNGVASAPFLVTSRPPSPAFPLFDAQGHVVARHLDYSLLGPTTLFPGSTTPAKAGETVILVAFGLGVPNPSEVEGSATQTGTYGGTVPCWISGFGTNALAAQISPGLTQLNVTVPAQVPSGENAITCAFNAHPFFPGAIITIQ